MTNAAADSAMTYRRDDRALDVLYREHYRPLVRLAALLVTDVPVAERVVQDSFVAMYSGCHRLGDSDTVLSYLRRSVVTRCRSVRPPVAAESDVSRPLAGRPAAGDGASTPLARSAVIVALRRLPARQQEAVVLRYYGNLSEAQVAAAMGISPAAMKDHMARGMQALSGALRSHA